MDVLSSILRAAYCRSTHHYFAMDALPLVQTDAGRRLVGHLLRHHRRYLSGAIDPDVRFRDFQNHVVHVDEGYWGGAPRVAHRWYDRMLRYLRTDRFADAAHAAGVLSHYFTDPMQPLHTHSCDREAVIHRPLEWTVLQSYESILADWKSDEMRVVFCLSDRSEWLGEAVLHGARFARHRLQRVLDDFDLASAVRHPAQGLSPELRASMAELFGIAITGWARVIERAARDAELSRGRELPQAGWRSATFVAMLLAPLNLSKRRSRYAHEQQSVEALYEEYATRGRLRNHLPAEVDVVQRVVRIYQREKLWKSSRQVPQVAVGDETILKMDEAARTLSHRSGTPPNDTNTTADTHTQSGGRRAA